MLNQQKQMGWGGFGRETNGVREKKTQRTEVYDVFRRLLESHRVMHR